MLLVWLVRLRIVHSFLCMYVCNVCKRVNVYDLYWFTAATQRTPKIVIAHPGQDVELLCTVTVSK